MNSKLIRFSIVLALLVATKITAQQTEKIEELDEVVVTATKFPIKKEKVGKIIYQITPTVIENYKGHSVIEVLDNLAGISINGTNNTAGKNKSTFIRGGRDKQVLVLIDGIPVSDPSGITTNFDLRLLALNQIESIEVMNGSASTLYGSGAASGVINIKLKQAANQPLSLKYQASVGTNNSQNNASENIDEINQNASISGKISKFNYLVSINTSKIDGMSEASNEMSNTPFENDTFLATNSFAKLGYQVSESFTFQVFGSYDKNTYDFDAGAFSDSDINNGANKQQRVGIVSNYVYNKGNVTINASYTNNNRIFSSFNGWTNATDFFEYTGKTYVAEVTNKYQFNNQLQLLAGVNYQKQNNLTNSPYGSIDEDLANYYLVDPFITAVYNSNFGFNLNAGVRLNYHSEYGTHLVYNVNPSYNFSENLRALFSYSTAFIAPSTYQLFSQYGNIDLKPEESTNYEAGFVFGKPKNYELSSVFFYREDTNPIILPDFITYRNGDGTIISRGIETNLKLNVIDNVAFNLGHAYTHKSADLDYIPKHKYTASLDLNTLKRTFLSLKYKGISERTYFDQWGSGDIINIDSYNLFDVFASYSLIENRLSVFGSVTNIFNEDYIETIGYTTRGRNFKIGLDFTF